MESSEAKNWLTGNHMVIREKVTNLTKIIENFKNLKPNRLLSDEEAEKLNNQVYSDPEKWDNIQVLLIKRCIHVTVDILKDIFRQTNNSHLIDEIETINQNEYETNSKSPKIVLTYQIEREKLLDSIKEMLTDRNSSRPNILVIISGMSGTGKTIIISELFKKNFYRKKPIWLNISSLDEFRQKCESLQITNLPNSVLIFDQINFKLLKQHFILLPEKVDIFILTNISPDHRPQQIVGMFTVEELTALCQSFDLNEAVCLKLGNILGNHPRAVYEAFYYAKQIKDDLNEIIAQYLFNPAVILGERSSDDMSTIDSICKMVENIYLSSKYTRKWLPYCGFLNPQKIPKCMLIVFSEMNFSYEVENKNNIMIKNEIIRTLVDTSLLDGEPDEHSYSVHNILHAVLNHKYSTEMDSRIDKIKEIINTTIGYIEKNVENKLSYRKWDEATKLKNIQLLNKQRLKIIDFKNDRKIMH